MGPASGSTSTRWPSAAWWHDVAEDEPIAAAALDANFAELIRWYASRPGGEIVEGGDVTLCSTGLAFRSINCAVEIDLAPATADRADRRGRRLVRGARPVRGAGWSGRPAGPLDLGERLVRAGYELVSDSPGMALDLDGFEPEPPPTGVEIVTVDDLAGLDAWEELQRRALILDDGPSPCLARRPRSGAECRHPVARLDRAPRRQSRSPPPPCSSPPEWPASTTWRPCPRPAVVASAVRSRRPPSPRPSRAASTPRSSARPRWATRSTAACGFREVSRLRSYAWGASGASS